MDQVTMHNATQQQPWQLNRPTRPSDKCLQTTTETLSFYGRLYLYLDHTFLLVFSLHSVLLTSDTFVFCSLLF